MFKRKGNGGLWSCRTGPGSPFFWYASFLYFLKRVVFVKWHVSFFRIYYLSATTKEEFMTALSNFTNPQLSDHSMILEVFTDSKDESEALYLMSHIQSDAKGMVRSKLKDAVRNVAGEKGINAIKKILKK